MDKPLILIGMDAQHPGTFDWIKSMGCNALHRYDSGPQKSVTVAAWRAAAQAAGLFYVIQGDALDAQGWPADLATDPYLISVGQPDEPDLNRLDGQRGKVSDADLAKQIYFPAAVAPSVPGAVAAPHPSMVGWTLASVAADRYQRWKALAPNVPISINLNGQNLINAYYGNGAQHQAYLDASDVSTADLYARNARGTAWPLYYLMVAFDRLNAWDKANAVGAYVECSDQVLDGVENGGPYRGPTPNEQSTLVWMVLGHGGRQIIYFPQRIGGGNDRTFKYENVSPENEAQMKKDNAFILWHQKLIATGSHTMVQTPKFQNDTNKGTMVFPTTEVHTWTLGDETLVVSLDLSGATAPAITYAGSHPYVEAAPAPVDPNLQKIADLTAQLTASQATIASQKGAIDEATAAITKARQQIDGLATQLTEQAKTIAGYQQLVTAKDAVINNAIGALGVVVKSLGGNPA